MSLDPRDLELVRATQEGLPLVERPFLAVASRLGWSEAEVLARLRALLERRAVRRIALVPDHFRLGYVANGMCVFDVDDARVSELGRQVGSLPFVSHCYRRPRVLPEWPYNLFAMVHGRDRSEVLARLPEILAVLGDACHGHDVLWSRRILKKTGLRLREPRGSQSCFA
ncbi:hypothetical protein HRbin40_00403 [bacterium HR40]|nr:hypothetical protein HRbin40_00403 [bacterium HR40]